ncbi:hypothetical protein ACWKX9_23245 [Enterobacter asburiae]
MNLRKTARRLQKTQLLPLTTLALAIGFSAASWGGAVPVIIDHQDGLKMLMQPLPSLSPLNRVIFADYLLKTEANFTPRDVYLRVCGDLIDKEPDNLANYIHSSGDKPVMESGAAKIALKAGRYYRVRVPLAYGDPIRIRSTKNTGMSISYVPYPGKEQTACPAKDGADTFAAAQSTDVLPLADVTPVIQPLDWRKQTISTTDEMFDITVDVTGATADDTVVWSADTDVESIGGGDTVTLVTKDALHDRPLIRRQQQVYGVTLPEEKIGRTFTHGILTPTMLTYTGTASLQRGGQEIAKKILVGGPDTRPYLNFQKNADDQFVLLWQAVIPYRNDNGKLGINTRQWSAVSHVEVPDIYSIDYSSTWQDLSLFKGAVQTSISQGNVGHYSGPGSSLLSDGLMPHAGAFTLNVTLNQK